VGRKGFPTPSAAPSLLADAAVDVASRKHSFPSIDSIADNSIDPARRAESGWVVSSVFSIRSALRSVSNLPTARLSLSLSLTSKSLSPGHGPTHRPSGNNLAVVAQRELSEPAKTLSFHAKRRRPRSPVPISGRRPSRPALESMIKRGRTFIAEQPRDLPERHPRILQILSREALPQLVDDLTVCCSFVSQSSREGAQAEGQSLRNVFGFRFAVRQQLLHFGFNRRAQRSRFYVPLLRSFGSAVISGRRRASDEI
jgi:hypothetical protein